MQGRIYGAKSAYLAFIVGFAATGVILLSLPLVSREVKLTPLVPVLVIHGCTCLDEVGKIPRVMLHYKKCKRVRNLTR